MNFKLLFRGFPAALTMAVALLTARAGAAIPPAENLLPEDTFAVLSVPDCATFRQELAVSPEYMWWNDPAMRPFRDRLVGKWKELFVGPIESDLGLDLGSFVDLPQGQFTFAITRNGWDGADNTTTPGWVLLLDAGNKGPLLATNALALQHKWLGSGKTVRTETAHGITFSVVPLSTNDIPGAISSMLPANPSVQEAGVAPKPPKTVHLVIGQYKSVLIMGDSLATVEPVAARLTGGSAPCLADNAQFQADKASQFHGSPAYYCWLNTHALFETLSHIPAPAPNPDAPTLFTPPSVASVLTASGLMGLKSVSMTFEETHEGATTSIYLSAPEATRQGFIKMLAIPSKDSAPPAFVPADAMKYWRWRLDARKAWAELEKSLAAASPTSIGSLNGFFDVANGIARQKNPDFDLRRDLIGNLGDDLLSYERAPSSGSTAELANAGGIFLFAAEHPDQTLLAIKTVVSLVSPQEGAAASQDFMGHSIYTLALRPQVSATTGATTSRSIYCTIGSGYIAMSSDISVLQDYLRSAAKPPLPLAQKPGLADAAQHVGGMNGGLFGYQDNQVVMRAAFNAMKQSGAAEGSAAAMLPKALTEMFDYSLLPDFDKIAKYFYFSVFASTSTPDGISFKGFYPRPPKVN